jgi:hypothetical protein
MKYAANRPFADPEKAARKLIEIANTAESYMDQRVSIGRTNAPFLKAAARRNTGPASISPRQGLVLAALFAQRQPSAPLRRALQPASGGRQPTLNRKAGLDAAAARP